MAFPATLDLIWQGDGTTPEGEGDAIYHGDDYTLQITHQDGAGTPINVTGRTVLAQVRTTPRPQPGDVLATFDVDSSQAAAGVIVLTIPAAACILMQVGNWYWDYQETDTGVVSTIVRGRADVVGDVSQ